MGINEFAEKVSRAIARELGNGYTPEIKEVKKNNGVVLHGMLIHSTGQNVIPTIYLESFWEAYETGVAFSVIVGRILQIYNEDTPKKRIDMSFFSDFGKVQEKICFRLIRQKGNEGLLREIPHVKFLDLAICFFYAYHDKAIGDGAILIYHSHLQMWKTDVEELYKLAKKNTPRLYQWECSPMEAVLEEAFGMEQGCGADICHSVGMKILSNEKRIQGAITMLYTGVLEQIAQGEKCNFYILPSSVHEVILIKDTGKEDPYALKSMVEEVNSSVVAPEEVLSDSLYYFDLQEKKIKLFFR